MAEQTGPTPPIPFTRLKQIATDACQSAIGNAEFYDHAKSEEWNTIIVSSVLKALISESTRDDASSPGFKFACNSTVVQHLVPTQSLNKPKGTEASEEKPHISTSSEGASSTDGKPHVGRRGMRSSTGAYWDDSKDGMWTYKYDGGEGKGMDVVIMIIWIAI